MKELVEASKNMYSNAELMSAVNEVMYKDTALYAFRQLSDALSNLGRVIGASMKDDLCRFRLWKRHE